MFSPASESVTIPAITSFLLASVGNDLGAVIILSILLDALRLLCCRGGCSAGFD
jgi:hypothetical protein